MFNEVKDAIHWLENIKRKDKRENLNRIKQILEEFGNPQNSYQIVHVAGTNGKGSTSSILSECLSLKYNVGAFTSPYVVKFNERIKLNNKYIEDEILLKYINIMKEYSENYNAKNDDIIPFFEIVFVISLLYFKESKVDVAVIEVGVGGLLDCTNIVNANVSLITNIGLDHTSYLGSTLESIADHKLGILKEGNQLFTTVDIELEKYFKKYCRKNKVKCNIIKKEEISNINLSIENSSFSYNGFDFKTSLIGVHQVYNSVLAIKVLNDYFKFSYFEINKQLSNINFCGRFEIICNKPLTILDGAHNIDGINSLVKTVKLLFNKKVHFCFAAMKDKDIQNMIEQIEDVAQSISFTQINYYRTNEVSNFNSNIVNVNYFENVDEAVKNIKIKDDEILIYTGSLYFISEIRNKYNSKTPPIK